MQKFEVGDRVEAIKSHAPIKKGMKGKVICVDDLGSRIVKIEWDTLTTGHRCGKDFFVKRGHGWNVNKNEIKKIS